MCVDADADDVVVVSEWMNDAKAYVCVCVCES